MEEPNKQYLTKDDKADIIEHQNTRFRQLVTIFFVATLVAVLAVEAF